MFGRTSTLHHNSSLQHIHPNHSNRGFQNIQGVTFNLEEVSDGDQAVGFTYTIEIAGQPRGIRGITYYQATNKGG